MRQTPEDRAAGLDLDRLRSWFGSRLPGHAPPDGATLVAGGRSNLTYAVHTADGDLILRRPPLGHVLSTAHDMGREFRVLSALGPAGFPVPRAVAYCADQEPLGAPFYLMNRVAGRILRAPADCAGVPPAGVAEALIDTLAALHRVDPERIGLGDFGHPAGFTERQVRRWSRQLDASRTRDLPDGRALAKRLAAAVPRNTPAGLVHGDYRLDNLVLAADHPAVAAVLDWEMSTVGDPLTDLGLALVYWDGLHGIGAAVPWSPGGTPGWPDGAAFVARYRAAGGVEVRDLGWYVAFAYFKLAVVLEGIHCRHLRGLTVGDGFADLAPVVPELLRRGHATLDQT